MTEQANGTATSQGMEERYVGPLQPDTVLPHQFFGALRRRSRLDGERRLMMAVLEDAVHCYRKHAEASDPRAKQLFLDAEAWINGTDRLWCFSFENVCDTLELDPDYVREGLMALKSTGRRSVVRQLAEDQALRSNS